MNILERLELLDTTGAEDRFADALNNFEDLGVLLQHMGHPDQVLVLLKTEILARNRDSYIERIYGRYRKLLPRKDKDLIEEFRRTYGQG